VDGGTWLMCILYGLGLMSPVYMPIMDGLEMRRKC